MKPFALSSRRGFTIVEFLVATGLGSLVLAVVASLTFYGTRSSLAIVNYTDLDAKSRYALDVIGREIRQATAVTAFSTNASLLSFSLTNIDQAVGVTVTYRADARTVVMTKTGQPAITNLIGCDLFNFSMYQRTPIVTPTNILFYPATNTYGVLDKSLCKLISISWKCSRQILAQKVNTESVQAAQIVLRQKQ